jgi:hypothetical protein
MAVLFFSIKACRTFEYRTEAEKVATFSASVRYSLVNVVKLRGWFQPAGFR